MASRPATSTGGILGFALGLAVIGGILGAPLYLSHFLSRERALEAAVADDVEIIRRVIVNFDHNVSVIAEARGVAADDDKPNFAEIEAHLSENADLITKANAALTRLGGTAVDGARAESHLGVSQMAAMLALAEAQLAMHRADLHRWRRDQLLSAAGELADACQDSRKQIELLKASKPTAALAATEGHLRTAESRLSDLGNRISQLTGLIDRSQDRLQELGDAIAAARAKTAELLVDGVPAADRQEEYEALSRTLREAEAEAAALQFGTLEGATLVNTEDNLLTAAYEGGKSVSGLRDLIWQREQLESERAVWQDLAQSYGNQRDSQIEEVARVDQAIDDTERHLREQTTGIDDYMRQAAELDDSAGLYEKQIRDALAKASSWADKAVRAAEQRRTDSQALSREPGRAEDSLLKLVSQDAHTPASATVSRAEVAYFQALADWMSLDRLRAGYAARAIAATKSGLAAPDSISEQLTALRSSGRTHLEKAAADYQAAQKTLGNAPYVWTLEAGEAAVHLLEANLSEDPAGSEATAARDRAYELLSAAAQGREQSPLLTPVIDTILFLQRTAR